MLPISFYLALIDDPTKQELFNRLCEKYSTMVYNRCFKFTQDPGLIEEILQETFLKVAIYIDKYSDNDEQNRIHIYIMVRSAAFNILKRERRKTNQNTNVTIDDYEQTLKDPKNLQDYVFKNMTLEDIAKAVEKLGDIYRDCFILFYYNGLSINQIAHDLGVTPDTVKKRLQRAREFIRKCIEEGDFDDK